MKLSVKQIEQVHEQMGVDPVPEDSPAQEQLQNHFGNHTFYVDARGLHVWEELEPAELPAPAQTVTAVQVASWADDEKTALAPHAPVPGNAVVQIDREASKKS